VGAATAKLRAPKHVYCVTRYSPIARWSDHLGCIVN